MRRGTLSVLLTLILLSVTMPATGRQLLFNSYTQADGLPDDGITGIAQDRFGFIWVGTKEGVCRYDGTSFHVPPEVEKVDELNATVYSLFIDADNKLWALTDDYIVRLDLDTGEAIKKDIRHGRNAWSMIPDGNGRIWAIDRQKLTIFSSDFSEEEHLDLPFTPTRISRGLNGTMWLSSPDGFLYSYDKRRNSFNRISVIDEKKRQDGKSIRSVQPVDSRMIMVSDSDTDVYLVNTDRESSSLLLNIQKVIDGARLQDMLAVESDEFWFATDKGLIVYYRSTGKTETFFSDPVVPLSLCGTNLRKLYMDSFGRVWVGSFYRGISCLESSPFQFYTGTTDNKLSSIGGKTIRAFTEDSLGNIWMASEDGYVVMMDTKGSTVSYAQADGLPAEGNYQAIATYGGNLLIGAYGGGILVFNPVSHRLMKKYSAGNNNIAAILVTRDDSVYAGASDGLYKLDKTTDTFMPVEGAEGFVHALRQDRSGRIWIGYYHERLKIYNPDKMSVSEVTASMEGDDPGFVRTTSLFEDQAGDIWMTTENKGVYRIDPVAKNDGTFDMVNIRKADGLPSDVTCAMVQSPDGRLWLSTMRGIVSLNQDGKILGINRLSKIGNFFRYGAALLSDRGRIYMGTSEGALSFNPEDMQGTSHKLFLSSITYGHNDSNYNITEEGHSSVTTRSIMIHARDASYIRMDLASVAPVTDEGLEYSFSLEKKDKRSETISDNPSITYANLTSGKYLFTAHIAGSSDSDSDLTLDLEILPPFMFRKGMKYTYLLLLMLALAGCVMMSMNRIRKKAMEAKKAMEESMQMEMYESKISFFTGISHEIRTHLTLIKLSIDHLIKHDPDEVSKYSDIQTNIDKLIEFANLVLDMRKVDAGKMTLQYAITDVTMLFKDVCRSFQPIADTYSIKFSFDCDENTIMSLCSASSIEKVLNNLLMNGIKYCSSSVDAHLGIKGSEIVIEISSDGERIPDHERVMIFKPFYQSEQSKSKITSFRGSGLGLPLSRSLAEMHGGSLVLDDDCMEGNKFILSIPLREAESSKEKLQTGLWSEAENGEAANGKNTILVVEDDINLNNYIARCFSDDYTVMQASNGIEALDVLGKHNIDLVLSDIKMPEMDGCELCNKIKNTLEYSHIPVILLTAVTDNDTQIATLRSGADAFISKPFSTDLLTATVNNVFRNRDIMANRFATQPMSEVTQASGSQVEDTFMKHLYEYVIENCSNPELLSVSSLANHMCVSRSTLFRKVKAKANCNVNEYVMTCRLRKSAELLSTGKYRINEVAATVGIMSSSYFAKLFQKQYGISPSAFLESHSAQN